MSDEKKSIVTGYDFFFDGVGKMALHKMAEILGAKVSFYEDGTSEDEASGVLTKFFEKNIELTQDGILNGLMINRECGEHLAKQFGCTYTGSEFYVKKGTWLI